MQNIIHIIISCKASHYLRYPPGTRSVSHHNKSHGSALAQTGFFGLCFDAICQRTV